MSAPIILRIRTQLGTWRLKDVMPSDTLSVVRRRIEVEHHTDLTNRPLTYDLEGKVPIPDQETVAAAGLVNGSMIFVSVDESRTGVHEQAQAASKRITKEGNVVAQDFESASQNVGFRPGMMSLKSIKKQWTLSEFCQLDEQFVFRLGAQKPAHAKLANADTKSMQQFIGFARSFDFRQMRVGYLYGTFNEAEKSTNIDFIYEPAQECTDISFQLLDDPLMERVEKLAKLLGKRRVGWIFAHPPREKGFFFSCQEVLTAAEFQLECAEGAKESLFVTIKATLDEAGEPLVDAWQISQQGLEMVAEGALELSVNLGRSKVVPTFTAIVEGKPVPEIDNNFFVVRVGIGAYESQILSDFARPNRFVAPSKSDLKTQIDRENKKGWTLKSLLLDFHLLLFLSDHVDIDGDMPHLVARLLDPEAKIGEGYDMIIRSVAGCAGY